MRNLLFAFGSGLLASCANVPEGNMLYDRYAEYAHQLNSSNVKERYLDFFSQELVGEDELDDEGTVDQLLFSDLMHTEAGHAEAIDGKSGCLTVNGYDKENLPMAFSLQYSRESRWLISALHIAYLNDSSEFSSTARCPSEYLDQI